MVLTYTRYNQFFLFIKIQSPLLFLWLTCKLSMHDCTSVLGQKRQHFFLQNRSLFLERKKFYLSEERVCRKRIFTQDLLVNMFILVLSNIFEVMLVYYFSVARLRITVIRMYGYTLLARLNEKISSESCVIQ